MIPAAAASYQRITKAVTFWGEDGEDYVGSMGNYVLRPVAVSPPCADAAGVAAALAKISGSAAGFLHCNCNEAGNCLNLSVCAYTTGKNQFTVTAWNPNGQPSNDMLRIPVTGGAWVVKQADGASVPCQTSAIDDRTLELPLLYINYAGMNNASKAAAVAAHTNAATHILTFSAPVPAVGYATYTAAQSTEGAKARAVVRTADQPATVSNEFYKLSLDYISNRVTMVTNLKSGVSTSTRMPSLCRLISATVCAMWLAPPSGTSSRSTEVITM